MAVLGARHVEAAQSNAERSSKTRPTGKRNKASEAEGRVDEEVTHGLPPSTDDDLAARQLRAEAEATEQLRDASPTAESSSEDPSGLMNAIALKDIPEGDSLVLCTIAPVNPNKRKRQAIDPTENSSKIRATNENITAEACRREAIPRSSSQAATGKLSRPKHLKQDANGLWQKALDSETMWDVADKDPSGTRSVLETEATVVTIGKDIEEPSAAQLGGRRLRSRNVERSIEPTVSSRKPDHRSIKKTTITSGTDTRDVTEQMTDQNDVDDVSVEEAVSEHDESSVESLGDTQFVELFGQEDAWKTVREGARAVGMSEVDGRRVKEKPKLETRVGRGLIAAIGKSMEMFTALHSYQESNQQYVNGLSEGLHDSLEKIEKRIEDLSEKNAGTKRSETIQDVYAYAIPELVELLRLAFRCRTDEYSDPQNIEALEEIIWLQDMICLLCEKSRAWEAKPKTKRRIVKAIEQKVSPYLRDLRNAFQAELEKRQHVIVLQNQDEQIEKLRKKRDDEERRRKEDSKRKKEDSRRRIDKDLQRYRATSGCLSEDVASDSGSIRMSPPRSKNIPSSHQWTDLEDEELLIRLQMKDTRYLPAERRYLTILNAPRLKNKLPAHIRERALYWKAALEIVEGQRSWILSIE